MIIIKIKMDHLATSQRAMSLLIWQTGHGTCRRPQAAPALPRLEHNRCQINIFQWKKGTPHKNVFHSYKGIRLWINVIWIPNLGGNRSSVAPVTSIPSLQEVRRRPASMMSQQDKGNKLQLTCQRTRHQLSFQAYFDISSTASVPRNLPIAVTHPPRARGQRHQRMVQRNIFPSMDSRALSIHSPAEQEGC